MSRDRGGRRGEKEEGEEPNEARRRLTFPSLVPLSRARPARSRKIFAVWERDEAFLSSQDPPFELPRTAEDDGGWSNELSLVFFLPFPSLPCDPADLRPSEHPTATELTCSSITI